MIARGNIEFMKLKIKILVLLTLCVFSMSSPSVADSDVFIVYLNDHPHSRSEKVRPCYPVMARFEHSSPAVTRVRMRYPYNHNMYMIFPVVEGEVHIKLHEDFMRRGQLSLSDFIAEDEAGNVYGQVTLTFIPLDPENGTLCDAYVNS